MLTRALPLTLLLLLVAPACGGAASSYDAAPSSSYYGAERLEMAVATDSGGGAHEFSDDEVSGELDRKFVRNARIEMEVDDEDDFLPTLERARALTREFKGYVSGETERSITMMIPTARLDPFLEGLAKLGEITSKNVNVRDVTANYVDLKIQIDNLRRMRQRLQELVQQSVSVSEVLEVEKELRRVTQELERLEGQMRVMERDTSFATVTLSLEEDVDPGPVGWIFYGTYHAVKWLFVWD